jgi:hypothetical protein
MADTPAGGGRADIPAGGGQADTPAGGGQAVAILRMGIHACAMGEGRIRREPQRGGRGDLHVLLVINGELGQFALYHQPFIKLLCGCLAFAFFAVPHFNNRYLRVACSPSRASTATSTAPPTP